MSGTVRIGMVSDVNTGDRTARVYYHEEDMMSDWLKVLSHPTLIQNVEAVGDWMPAIGDSVLCLYMDVFNGDGYILGVLS